MNNSRQFSTALVAVLMVLAAGCTAVAFTDTSADTNAQMQQRGQDAEPNDDRQNATAIEKGANIDGSLEGSDTVDWYKFEAEAGQAIRAGGIQGTAFGNLTLYDSAGNELANTTTMLPERAVGAIADETGTYYVRVANEDPENESVSYRFRVKTASPDEFEPNDDRESAAAIDPGERLNATLFEGEEDWYAIDVNEGENLTVAARSDEADSTSSEIRQTFRIEIRTPDGELVAENRTVSVEVGFQPTATVSHVAEQSGTYYVRIVPTSFDDPTVPDAVAGFVGYSLTADTSGAVDQPTETPDDAQTETPTETETPQPTTDTPTETPTATPTPTETPDEPTEQPAEEGVVYYQVDFVVGEPIENLRGPEGTYTNDQLIRFVHGSTEEPVTRRAPGAFAYAESNVEERIESQEITVENGTATVTFTIDEGESLTLSLASYEKPGPGWSPETESEQEFVDAQTETFGPGTHTLTVSLPGESDEADAGTQTATEGGEGELSVAGLSADADGDDNNNLNDEYLVYENTGDAPLDLSGWTVTDASGATFTFPDGFTLAPGEQVTLYTGSGTNTDSALYWGQANEVWNNGADTMTVRNADGEIVLQRSYP